jgi:hypothetical protein
VTGNGEQVGDASEFQWSRGDTSDIDGQTETSQCAGANESKLSEFNSALDEWSRRDASDIDGSSREAERSGSE